MIDRTDEIARLREAADRPPQLVVLRGRRRIGKSRLLDHSLGDRRLVFLQADEQDEAGHLALLASEAARLLPGTPPLSFTSWEEGLTFLGNQARQKPLVVVLDEFQYLLHAQKALDSIIARHWDVWEREQTPITLALSGSALTLMEDLLGPGRPLFGRATYRPLLGPLDYRQASEFAPRDLSTEAKLRRYAVLGGTPQYQVWAGKASLAQILRNRVLAKGESLYEEPLNLLRGEQQIRDPSSYFGVLKAIAAGNRRHSDIVNATRLDSPSATKMLGRLEQLAYVELVEPVSVKAVSGRSSYRIADPYFRFWFRYVFPNRSRLERGRVDEVLAEIESDLDNFMGPVFEDCCREWVGRYAAGTQAPSCDRLGAWWSRDGQQEIDVVGVYRDRYRLLGSCKWDKKAGSDVLGKLLKARDSGLGAAAGKAALFIFARGFHDKLVARARDEGVTLVAARDLFR